MEGVLNILNGDATLEKFQYSKLPGTILVWREILSEGPVRASDYEAFFRLRAGYLNDAFDAPTDEYDRKVVQEFNRLRAEQHRFKEIILWFEFDLTDQINLCFLLNFFQHHRKTNRLSLVCPAEFPGYPNFKGIGELKPEELAVLSHQKIELTDYDLQVGAEGWQAYCTENPEMIAAFLKKDHGELYLLKPALEAPLDRFPDHSGLNRIDRELIEIFQSGTTDRKAIFRKFSDQARIYGMTDLSVYRHVDRLEAGGYLAT